jgi:trehalose utilization protein
MNILLDYGTCKLRQYRKGCIRLEKIIRVTVWNEFRHEKLHEQVTEIYPEGMHTVIAEYLKTQDGLAVRTATLDEPGQGLPDEILNSTDVLIWWGHLAHDEVKDELVDRIHQRVLDGMGIIVLHSAHASKIFRKLMGTATYALKWRDVGEKERLWVVAPNHPIADGISEYIEIEKEEMYGERFEIPDPDKLIFISWFEGGEVFRSGCCYERGMGKVFYFRPGHEAFPVYYNQQVLKVIKNAVLWAAPLAMNQPTYGKTEPLELLK